MRLIIFHYILYFIFLSTPVPKKEDKIREMFGFYRIFLGFAIDFFLFI